MSRDLTNGAITKELILFSLPMMAGNFLQQLYNIADTVIVGRVVGANALAAVGSAYALCGVLGENGIWIAIPIGWLAADLTGYGYYMLRGKILRKPSRF